MSLKTFLLPFALCLLPFNVLSAAQKETRPTNLRCEYQLNPLGIDILKPRLSWITESEQRGQRQTAYAVLVASAPDFLEKGNGDLWESGKITSDQSIQVE